MDCERLRSHQSDLSPQIPSAFLTGKWGAKLRPSLLHELTIPELPSSLACLLSAKGYCGRCVLGAGVARHPACSF